MKIKNPVSKTTLILIFLALIIIWHWLLKLYGINLTNFQPLTWDVFGYYVYLPAVFDYHDLPHAKFYQDIVLHYPDYSNYYIGSNTPNGNFIFKYSCGNAIMYMPFYLIGKLCASILGYPQDGLSLPYRLSMIFCGFFYSFTGLIVLRKVLINFFNDRITAFVLIAVTLATNYVEYSTYTSLLTHNILFFIYSSILLVTIQLHKKFSYKYTMLLGLLLGLAPLIRPTEIVAIFIPLLYGIENYKTLLQKINSLRVNYRKIAVIILIMGLLGSVQIIYWKVLSGNFYNYTYGDQSFDFTSPHFYYGMFSTTNGWLVYTPIMFFALIGIYFCYRQIRFLFWSMLIYVLCHMYFTFSWHIWWYGSSFGQRAMIQSYPMLSIALGCLTTQLFKKTYKIIAGITALLLFIWLNLFQTYQAHKGIINIDHMNDLYFAKIWGKSRISNKEYKFLSTDEELDSSQLESSKPIYKITLPSIDSSFISPNPDSIKKNEECLLLNSKNNTLTLIKNDLKTLNLNAGEWIVVSFGAYIKDRIFSRGDMTIIKATTTSSGQITKERFIWIPDKIGNNDPNNFDPWGHNEIWDRLTFDFRIPDNASGKDSIFVSFYNPGHQDIYLNDIKVDGIKTK